MKITKNRKTTKRLGIVYALFMTMGVAFGMRVFVLGNVFEGVDQKVEQVAQREEEAEEKAVIAKATVMGNIYDRNRKLLVTTSLTDGFLQYKHDTDYTNTIGFFIRKKGSMLLMENYEPDLFYTSGETDKGRNLMLTLDSEVQEYAHQLINMGSQEKGSITVLDAKTGAVIAMAYNPSISIQEIQEYCSGDVEIATWRDFVVNAAEYAEPLQSPTVPGSIFKIVTSIGILENGLENEVVLDEGVWEKGEERNHDGTIKRGYVKIENAKKARYGNISFERGFIKSSNIYFGRMAYEKLGWNVLSDIAQRCQVGEMLKFDFGIVDSVYSSDLEPFDQSYPNEDLARSAFGYGSIRLSGLQAAMITQGIANDGVMCYPYMVDSIYETDGYEIAEGEYYYELGDEVASISAAPYKRGEKTQITNAEVADKITQAMLGVYEDKCDSSSVAGVESGGIVVNGVKYPVAIKTGTADIDANIEDYNNTWMVSFAPADNPQYVVVVNRFGVDSGYGAHLFDDVMKMYTVLFQ